MPDPDYKALCAELTEYVSLLDEPPHELAVRALALLAQPEPLAPTDEELLELLSRVSGLPNFDTYIVDGGRIMSEPVELLAYARAVLTRYGTPAIQPVLVSERLPEPEDCDSEGGCWWWHPDHKEDDFDDGWILLNPKWADGRRDSDDSLIYTHWLPANTLPVPITT
jgi:hypothetical protein